jgi:tRNA threonylcarbamoyladenosine biosynthesis protein TsaE
MQTYITKSFEETQKLGEKLAKKILENGLQKKAVVLGLIGNLGGGKTTFMQGFAKGLGVNEKILSPTYVILKHFKITKSKIKNQKSKFIDFYHIDCYRINNPEEILELDFKEIILNPKNIVAIEWPEKIKNFLSKQTIFIDFKLVDETIRKIVFKAE